MTVSVNGADLSCTTRGSGPACMVLSAIGTEPYVRQMPPPLTDHLTLVHVDLRGGGQSTGVAADLTLPSTSLPTISMPSGVRSDWIASPCWDTPSSGRWR